MPYKRSYISTFDGSIMELPIPVRLIWEYMIKKADWTGFVRGTEEALARIFNVPLGDLIEAIRILSSPDPKSRTPDMEGRRIEKVQGGWRIINFQLYQQVSQSILDSFSGTETRTGTGLNGKRIREVEADIDRETLPNRETQRNSVSQEAWHPRETAAYDNLPCETHRRFFETARYYAALAASKGKPDFVLATGSISKELGVTEQGAGKIRKQFVDEGILERTEAYDYRARKAARYRWTLETTIPVPEQASTEPDSDLDDNIPF
jgi:hypothetical protein